MTDGSSKLEKHGDALATGVVVMLALAVFQRLVGFSRSFIFCRLLDDEQLGRWSLMFSFLLMAAPLLVLGIPGTFGRYVESYRQQGQLRSFLLRTSAVCAVLLTVSMIGMWFLLTPLSWLLFGSGDYATMMGALVAVLALVTVANFMTETLMALRWVRLVAILQFLQSVTFAALGVGLLLAVQANEWAPMIAYGAGAAVVVVIGIWALIKSFSGRQAETTVSHTALWVKLLPFAGWMWLTNLMSNLFDSADRFMIIHLAPVGPSAEALVGQYHASRVVPLMLVALAGLLGGTLLPYLTHDWEKGNRAAVHRQMNLTLKLAAIGFSAGAVAILVMSPLLFGWFLQGKYDQGLSVLPWTLAYACWFGLLMLAQNYLWCSERAGRATLALFIGLAVNVLLNLWWLPRLGLLGAVMATSLGNLTALVLVLFFSARSGMKFDSTTCWMCPGSGGDPAGSAAGGRVRGDRCLAGLE